MEIYKILPVIERYLTGNIIDVGCGDSPVKKEAFGVDGRDFPCVSFKTNNLYDLPSQIPDKVGFFDTLVSSHTLEHLPDSYRAINEWSELLKIGGYFILYLPDGTQYNNYENWEHFHDTTYRQFLFWFKRAFCGEGLNFKGQPFSPALFEMVDSGSDFGDNRYSFFIIAKKIR